MKGTWICFSKIHGLSLFFLFHKGIYIMSLDSYIKRERIELGFVYGKGTELTRFLMWLVADLNPTMF